MQKRGILCVCVAEKVPIPAVLIESSLADWLLERQMIDFFIHLHSLFLYISTNTPPWRKCIIEWRLWDVPSHTGLRNALLNPHSPLSFIVGMCGLSGAHKGNNTFCVYSHETRRDEREYRKLQQHNDVYFWLLVLEVC